MSEKLERPSFYSRSAARSTHKKKHWKKVNTGSYCDIIFLNFVIVFDCFASLFDIKTRKKNSRSGENVKIQTHMIKTTDKDFVELAAANMCLMTTTNFSFSRCFSWNHRNSYKIKFSISQPVKWPNSCSFRLHVLVVEICAIVIRKLLFKMVFTRLQT